MSSEDRHDGLKCRYDDLTDRYDDLIGGTMA